MTSENKNIKLTKKFIKGLQTYNLSYEDIKKGDWKYSGGDRGRHLNYFILCYKDRALPPHKSKCICSHSITENCYITNGKEILTLGNCCIKKFIKKSTRTCEDCKKPHRNRKINKCNECKIGICYKCGKKCDEKYSYCYNCYMN